ncbi:MAG: Gfo/Idh/MocA family oxidoreductase [Candidatus Obscuribacterales bacterium]|nr:Gfo/Idh/MocA family oxidoreductase [Candidatus Obscuribacterales bacterium]
MSNSKLLRIGLIGTAQIADDYLLPALKQVAGAQFWSVLSRNQERGQLFASKHEAASSQAVHTSLASFLDDKELDAVIIASPDRLHAEQALAAAEAGKHLFVEKPLATSVEDAAKLVDFCRQQKLALAVGYHLRWHQGHRLVKQLLLEKKLGPLQSLSVQWTYAAKEHDWRATEATGRWWSLAATGTHCIDLCLWLAGSKVSELKANLTHAAGGHDESARLDLSFTCGAKAEVFCSVKERLPRKLEIHCQNGSIVCTNTLGPRGAGEIIVNGEPLSFETKNPYVGELADFAQSVNSGKQPESSGETGLANVHLLDLCH